MFCWEDKTEASIMDTFYSTAPALVLLSPYELKLTVTSTCISLTLYIALKRKSMHTPHTKIMLVRKLTHA